MSTRATHVALDNVSTQEQNPKFGNFPGINILRGSRPYCLAVLSTGKPPAAHSLGQNFLDLNLSIVGQSK